MATDSSPKKSLSCQPTDAEALRGTVKGSFAYFTLKDRVPTILVKAVNSLVQELRSHAPSGLAEVDAKRCISKISQLTYELQRDREISELEDSGNDSDVWNALIKEQTHPTWFATTWLFAECFVYRKLQEIFSLSDHWKGYDAFRTDKQASLMSSLSSINIIVAQLVVDKTPDCAIGAINERTAEFLMFSLWGNQADLSLFTNAPSTNSLHAESFVNLHSSKERLLVDDTISFIEHLRSGEKGRIDIVLDNAGLELFADLALAHWLLSTEQATSVVFHVKEFPWFVSDTTKSDFEWLLMTLEKHFESEQPAMLRLIAQWKGWLDNGQWKIQSHPFWTLPHSFWTLPRVAPDLYQEMAHSRCIVFKGDLNYRKAVSDSMWPTTSPLRDALGSLCQENTPALLFLRTCKSDPVVGLQSGQAEDLSAKASDWRTNGRYGMIQFQGLGAAIQF
ncbi:hypothetical protein DFS34DRAFT_574725 [Phlyctochytrium arcticum]|nr:hypothetical protein DFS34DRAFT_574725 [Phlyctochytrium arcticum]